MIAVLLILIPLLTGLAGFAINRERGSRNWAVLSSVITLAVMIYGVTMAQGKQLGVDTTWLPQLGSRFALNLDGMSKMLCLLTAVAFPLIFIATYKNTYTNPGKFYALMLLSQAGLMGVFMAVDCLVFYFFWELALIPVYFLCSIWGGEKRIAATFKFFIYTFAGSLLMLVGILYLYNLTPDHSFALSSFYKLKLSASQQNFGFWMFFIAFAIKMPIFPFHTWQPDTYEQSPTAVTMVLSGIMVKMGVFGVLRWLLPIFPDAVSKFSNVIIIFSIIGILYASLIAIKQDDLKRLIAYSSIAHLGLMSAAIFSQQRIGIEGVMVQMFNHGIVVIGLWIVADAIERQTGTRKFSQLGGLAQKAPGLAILLVLMAFANIALPLTNSFVGEFLMFNGLFRYNPWMAFTAGTSVILAAVYTLGMIQKVFYGSVNTATENSIEANSNIRWVLIILAIGIIILGVYPQPVINLTKDTVDHLITQIQL
ncbi:MAG: NADH-ubiquinone oxidoreductase chain [Chitinophagaceae bacterium]|nr:NADH-ubiquinone oxidoreductase chain [Chitinophagaceae bacterium]